MTMQCKISYYTAGGAKSYWRLSGVTSLCDVIVVRTMYPLAISCYDHHDKRLTGYGYDPRISTWTNLTGRRLARSHHKANIEPLCNAAYNSPCFTFEKIALNRT